jgi:hypothetical protein
MMGDSKIMALLVLGEKCLPTGGDEGAEWGGVGMVGIVPIDSELERPGHSLHGQQGVPKKAYSSLML